MKATLTVLGSGTSMGVPTLGCDCAVCRSSDPRDRRTRPSVMLEYAGKVVLIDTTPDFYAQAIRERITTRRRRFLHAHACRPHSGHRRPAAAQLLSTSRRSCLSMRVPMPPLFCGKMFSYIFDADYKYGSLPQLELRPIDGPVELFGARFEPVRLIHGEAEIYGFRFGSAAYLTDHSEIPEASFHQLEGLDILFLDALRHKPHPTHSTVENSLRIVERVKAKRAFFTHICHDLAHEATNATLPAHVRLAYDG